MSVVLVRIDDRLVHGQVVEGWLRNLRVSLIIVASDAVAADETQRMLYLLAVPHGIDLLCLTLEGAAAAWKSGQFDRDRSLVLTSSPEDVLRMLDLGAPIRSVNVGGLHFREGRVPALRAISLDERDVAALRGLASHHVILEARALPLDEPVDMVTYLEGWQHEPQSMGDQPR